MTTPATNQRPTVGPEMRKTLEQGAANLSGQQLQALAKNHADHLAAIKRDIELRKWAVDQACGLAGTSDPDSRVTFHDPIALAKAIHAFLVEGAEKAE